MCVILPLESRFYIVYYPLKQFFFSVTRQWLQGETISNPKFNATNSIQKYHTRSIRLY